MPEYSEERKEYAEYRIRRSKEDLVLAFDAFDSSKHSGVIAEFRRRYIKKGIFPVEMSRMIGDAFIIRNASDYDDMFIASKTGTQEQIDNADYVHQRIKSYIDDILDGENRVE